MKRQLLIVTEALEMNGVLRSLLDFMSVVKDECEISLFCFDAYKPQFVELPNYVTLLPEDPWCYMSRAPLARIVKWGLRHHAYWPLLRRLLVSAFQNRFPCTFCKQDLSKKARPLLGTHDVAIGFSMGMTWRFVAENVTAKKKLMWLDTDVHFEPWASYWRKYSPYLASAHALVCVSEATRDMMRREFSCSAKHIETIHNRVDTDAIVRKGEGKLDYPKTSKFRIVTIGRYCGPKNQAMIPLVAECLRQRGISDFEWIMAGPGSAGYKTNDQNLVYLDLLANPFPLMKSADLYVQPSTYEGWGLTLSEAMVLGRYVIASDIPAFHEQITNESEGLIVPCTPDAFTDAIAAFVRLPRTQTGCSVATRFGRDAIQKEFEYVLAK